MERNGPSAIYGVRNGQGKQFFKHPWGSRSMEFAGRGSTFRLNANGPFFNRTSPVKQQDSGAVLEWPTGNRMLTISNYNGGLLRRRKLRYCFTNWGTSLGGFPRITIPGTANLPETPPRCYDIAEPRLAQPHTTVPEAASEPQFWRLTRQRKSSNAQQTPKEAAS